jgi:hypothetical protein
VHDEKVDFLDVDRSPLTHTPDSSLISADSTSYIKPMKYSRSLVATLLMSGGLLHLAAPAFAGPTAANTTISNTATASYDDPTGIGSINTTSNPVTVTVAEIAGVNVTSSGISNRTTPGGAVTVGDQLYFNYTVTNTGNAPTTFNIPSNPGLTGPGTLTGVEYSIDGVNWLPVATGGTTTTSVGAGSSVLVRVAVTTNNGGGSTIAVQLGNANGNNQPFSASGAGDDVNTVGGNPANGQREGAASQQVNIGAIVKNVALASVFEKLTGVDTNGTAGVINDDILSYELSLKVDSTDVTNSGIAPVPLVGTDIKLDGATNIKRILVSSAIPTNTTLAAALVAPSGWKAVYTTDATSTIANAVNWSSVYDPTKVYTRVGFVNDPNVLTSVPIGTTLSVGTFKLKTTGATGNSYTVQSMAQVFGSSFGSVPLDLVYDESGDQSPNNFDPADPTKNVNTLGVATTSGTALGVATATYGIDTANDNTGSGVAGEVNEYIYTYIPAAPVSLLNGPSGTPTAIGPDGTTDSDFTNKSSAVPAGVAPGAQIDPAAVGFTNTVKNTGSTSTDITLLPELLTLPGTATLPVGTRVRIYTTGGSAQSGTYKVTATGFAFDPTATNNTATATAPVKLAGLASGVTADYFVEIDLPAGTDLSTTTSKGFPVVINAFTGGTVAPNGAGDDVVTGATASNKTIDRVYTGFIQLAKESRILVGSGPAVAGTDGTFSTTNKKPAAGNIIEYRITYTNISEKQIGSGNSILNARNLVITEDGTTTTNTWGQDKDNNGSIDTSNVIGKTVNTGGTATVQYFNGANGQATASDLSGTTATTDVTKYVDTVTTVVGPGTSGSFSFQRQLN